MTIGRLWLPCASHRLLLIQTSFYSRLFCHMLGLPNTESSISLMSSLIYSPFFFNHVDEIREVVDYKSNYSLRVNFVRRMNIVFAYCREEYLQIDENQYIDYKKPLSFNDLKKMLRFNSDKAVNKAIGDFRRKNVSSDVGKGREVELSYNIRLETAKNIISGLRRFENQDLYLLDGSYSAEELAGAA